jgi:hypothetical protein
VEFEDTVDPPINARRWAEAHADTLADNGWFHSGVRPSQVSGRRSGASARAAAGAASSAAAAKRHVSHILV